MIGKATPLVVEELSTREAAQRKSVSMATIRNWIKSGKISARKEKNRYIIAVDAQFLKAAKYQRNCNTHLQQQIAELREEIMILRHKIHQSDAHYHQIALLYDAALERAENLEEQLAKYQIWEVMLRCPEAIEAYLKRNFPDHQPKNHKNTQTNRNWLPPLVPEENTEPEIVYEPHYSPKAYPITIDSVAVSSIDSVAVVSNTEEDAPCK